MPNEPRRIVIQVTPEMSSKIDRLTSETDCSPEEIISFALNLMNVSLEAKKSGKHIGISEDMEDFDKVIDLDI